MPDGVRRFFRLRLRRRDLIHEAMDEELQFHLDERTAQLAAQGLSPTDAQAEAIRRLGGSVADVRNQLRRSAERKERTMAWHEHFEDLVADLRYAARGLIRRPAFTTVAVLTLAAGIGGNTAIFSAVDALLFRPLPFAAPDRLMDVYLVPSSADGTPGVTQWSWPKYQVLLRDQTVFSDIALHFDANFNLGQTNAERINGEFVSSRYLTVLGVAPIQGADFSATLDNGPNAPRTLLMGNALWQRRFGADPGLVGRTIELNGQQWVVQGILPPGFRGLSGTAEVLVPATTVDEETYREAWSLMYSAIGRLRPGVTPEEAEAQMRILGPRIYEAYPFTANMLSTTEGKGWTAGATSLDARRVAPEVRRSLLVLFGAVGFVLLIACVNLANFLLGRAATRRREIAIRLAIGSSRGRLVRLLLTESLLLASLGGAASLLVAAWSIAVLRAMNPLATLQSQGLGGLGVIGFTSLHLDIHALLFTFGVTLFVGLLFGLVPALQATRADLVPGLKDGAVPARLGGMRLGVGRGALVMAEVALAVVLLAGSGLMLRSLMKRIGVDPGFDDRSVLTLRLATGEALGRDSIPGFVTELQSRLAALPGVTSVGLADCPPLNGGCNGTIISFPDREATAVKGLSTPIGVHTVTPEWFATLHIPLLRGRLLTPADRIGTSKVILISESAAQKYWPNEDPLGKRAGIWQGGFQEGATVVGIVGDVRYGTIDSLPVPDSYMSFYQAPRGRMMIFLRTAGDPLAVAAAARRELAAFAPSYPVYDVQTMTSRVAGATAQARFSATLLGLFAAVALALAVMGIYGVMSFAVLQRQRELGIRMALGADGRDVRRLILVEGMGMALVGGVIGLGAAFALTRVLNSLLFEVAPSDPLTYAAIVLVLGLAAFLATWLPARRASLVDPVEALRRDG